MTLPTTSRVRAPLPILFFAAFLALAGCATSSPGPVGPISTGNPRVDPVPGSDTGDLGTGAVGEDGMGEVADGQPQGPYTPPHMAGREIVRAGVLLPFTHPNPRVRQQAEGMLAGIELALFDIGFEDIQDPYGITFWPQFKGRDGCRTPHPWQHNEINAGFTEAKPWLPVVAEHQEKSVNLQESSTDSVLNSYRHFSQWRKQHSALLYGNIAFIDTQESTLAFIREDNTEKLLVCFNFSNQSQTISLDLLRNDHSVLTDHNLLTAEIVDDKITLPAFGCFYASL